MSIGDQLLAFLTTRSTLTDLSLMNCQGHCTDSAWSQLARFSHLQRLCIQQAPRLSINHLQQCLEANPRLHSLEIVSCELIDTIPLLTDSRWRFLTSLSIKECRLGSAAPWFSSLSEWGKHLQSLGLESHFSPPLSSLDSPSSSSRVESLQSPPGRTSLQLHPLPSTDPTRSPWRIPTH